jgi:negative regulator of replication initiation
MNNDDDNVVKLDENQSRLVEEITKSFVSSLGDIIGRQMKAMVVWVPTTPLNRPNGKTQSLLISNMTPSELKRTIHDLRERITDEEFAKLEEAHAIVRAQAEFAASGAKAN